MFAITKESGQVMSSLDTCKVPAPPGSPIPVPFPNIGMTSCANPVTKKIMICGQPALTLASKISTTQGDEAGVAGGIVSGKIMGPAQFVMGSQTVQFEGNAALFMGNSTKQNQGNAVGCSVTPSQSIVMILS